MTSGATTLTTATTIGEEPVASTTTAPTVAPEHLLVRHIRAHIEKGDKAKDKAEQHYIAAGQHLASLKAAYAPTWAEWESILETQVRLSPSRASELMQLADGRKTVAQIRTDTNRRKIEHRKASSSFRNEEGRKPESTVQADREQVEKLYNRVVEAEAARDAFMKTSPGAPGSTQVTLIINALASSSATTRKAVVNALVSGTHHSQFEAVTNAVSDLYQRLSQAGR